jgi:putative spermidine/putrescine transport system permease protein
MTAQSEPQGVGARNTSVRRRARDPLLGGWKRWLLAVPVLVLTVPLLVVPLIGMVRASFDMQTKGGKTAGVWSFDNYLKFVTDPFLWEALVFTLFIGVATAVVCLVLGFPFAWFISRRVKWRQLQIAILIAPLLVNMVARVYGWQVLLADSGVINKLLGGLGLISEPIRMLYTPFAIIIALVHVLLPYMIMAIYGVLQTIDRSYENAARSLGATKSRVFKDIIFPLSVPGVATGAILVFAMAAGSFIVPSIMGGGRLNTLPTLVYQYAQVLNWPFASVIAIVLMVVTTPAILAYQRRSLRNFKSGR